MKRIISILLLVLILMPLRTYAKEITISGKKYNALNYEETLDAAKIEKKYDHYEETDDQVTIYLFRGKECEYCEDFLNFLSSITDEYGKYFKMVSFEIYDNTDNTELLEKVAELVGAPGEGIPLIIIGDKYYEGYSSEYEQGIKDAIKKSYDTPINSRLDVLKSMSSTTNSNSFHRTASSDFKIIVWMFIFFVISTSTIIIFLNNKISKLDDKVSMIRNKK